MEHSPALSWTSKTIQHLSLHRRRAHILPYQIGPEHVPFLIGYIFLLTRCYQTSGEPYAAALKEQKPSNNDTITTFSPYYEDQTTLPNPFLPAITPLLLLLANVISHALLVLFQVWFIDVRAFVKYSRVHSLEKATHVLVKPRAFKGKSAILPIITQNSEPNSHYFIFQRRKFLAHISETSDKQNDQKKLSIHFEKLKPPITEKIETYVSCRGIKSQTAYQNKLDLYGKNCFSIPQPTFAAMFQQQLLEPLTVFQIFSVCLYMLDEYWQYSLFTLFMILIFEGVTVMGRLRNLQTLGGMSNPATNVYVYRTQSWKLVSSEDLVPGDILSLTRDKKNNEAMHLVPCDCLLLFGSAVMNEATLTGESVPQMKESIRSRMNSEEMTQSLDMKATHKMHVLFGGTTIMQIDPQAYNISDLPLAPDNGCIVYVLRTGFSSSQGKLLCMIEFSSGKITSSSSDAIGLALLLLTFALISSTYVLYHGIAQKKRLTFDLLLRCVLIITSVIPAELPMQTSMAVNSALLSLVKLSVFCTEPFRIALAGKVDICLFDKTGTLTTDQLTAVSVVCDGKQDSESVDNVPILHASPHVAFVLAGCHSLVRMDGKLIGDPVEEASIAAIHYEYNAVKRGFQAQFDTERKNNPQNACIEILHRYHFASKLQRMSVIARITRDHMVHSTMALVKGSPEAIHSLLLSAPSYYFTMYKDMARRGMRVLALAYKEIDVSENMEQKTRDFVESKLIFAGFAAFQCLVRKDSGPIIKILQDSSHRVSMITGDAVLTAVHVSRQVGILSRETLILQENQKWMHAETDIALAEYQAGDLPRLVRRYDLCVSGKALLLAGQSDNSSVWDNLAHIRVFARMTPELKEKVLTCLKQSKHFTLMCGDGGNDVGALKQAHVGVALLSGFGSANADKSGVNGKMKKLVTGTQSREALMKLHVSAIKKQLMQKNLEFGHCKTKEELVGLLLQKITVKRAPVLTAEEKKEIMKKKQLEVEADVQERIARGESFARVRAMAAFAKREAAEAKRIRQTRNNFASMASSAVMQQYTDDFEDGQVPMIKLGDASIASPFTSRAPSIKACVDIIRQGRCALVSTMQMYQILAINCLISSYSLSVLYLDKVKYANSQMMALGIVSTIASVTLGRAKPLMELSHVRPLNSIFHPALFVSLIGQFSLHLLCMIYLSERAKAYIEVGDGSLDVPLKTAAGEYRPNVMGTVIFLVNAVQTVSVCAVNYKGRPFMQSMTDNPGLLYSLGISVVGVFLLCTESMPMFNKVLQVVMMPDMQFARFLTVMLVLDVLGAFIWDQLCVAIFAPKIFMASIQSTTWKDGKQILKMIVISLLVIYLLSNVDYDEIERQRVLLEKASETVSESEPVLQ